MLLASVGITKTKGKEAHGVFRLLLYSPETGLIRLKQGFHTIHPAFICLRLSVMSLWSGERQASVSYRERTGREREGEREERGRPQEGWPVSKTHHTRRGTDL